MKSGNSTKCLSRANTNRVQKSYKCKNECKLKMPPFLCHVMNYRELKSTLGSSSAFFTSLCSFLKKNIRTYVHNLFYNGVAPTRKQVHLQVRTKSKKFTKNIFFLSRPLGRVERGGASKDA